jgi:DNA-binding transcriptional LysR family regulator
MRGGDLIVFVPPELTSALVSRAVAEFRARYSNVEVILREAGTEATLQSLLSDASDIGLALNPVPRPEIESVATIDHRLGLVTPASIAVKEEGALAVLKTMPLATVDASSELHHLIVSAFEFAQIELSAAFTSNSIGLVKSFVRDGCGVALLPAPTVSAEVDAGTLAFHPLPELDSRDAVQVCVRRDRSHSIAADAFLAILDELITR